MKNKVALVTGGAGFIGSNLVDGLLAAGAEKVYVLDDLSTGFEYNLKHLEDDPRFGMVIDDVVYGIKSNTKHLIDQCDYVFHMAAKLEILHCDPIEDARTNILGTINVLNACLDSDVKKVIFASSGAVYGDHYMYAPEGQYDRIKEDDPKHPQWAYGASKLACEVYMEHYWRRYGLPSAAMRYSIIYGEREWHGRVLSVFIKQMLNNEVLEIFGNGEQVRDFLYIADAIEATIRAAQKGTGVMNISSGHGLTVNQLVHLLAAYSIEPIKITHINPKVGEKGRKPKELQYFVLDNSSAHVQLDWKPRYHMDVGLDRFIEWVKKEGLSRWTYPMRT